MKVLKIPLISLITFFALCTPPVCAEEKLTTEATVGVGGKLDINVMSENTLEMSLSKTELNFYNYNGTEDFTDDFEILINSSLNYDINVRMLEELKDSNNPDVIINKENIYIWEDGNTEQVNFKGLNEYINIVSNASYGKNKIHYIDFLLKGDSSIVRGNYNTVLSFSATQR